MREAFVWMLALLVSAIILYSIWTFPVVESEPDLCVTCMGWEGQRLAMTMAVPLVLIVVGIGHLLPQEPTHRAYDGCDACGWQPTP